MWAEAIFVILHVVLLPVSNLNLLCPPPFTPVTIITTSRATTKQSNHSTWITVVYFMYYHIQSVFVQDISVTVELFCSTPLAGLCGWMNISMRYLSQAEFAGNLLWNYFLRMKLIVRMSRLQCSFWEEIFSVTRWMSTRDMKGNSRPWEHSVFNLVLPHHRWIRNYHLTYLTISYLKAWKM